MTTTMTFKQLSALPMIDQTLPELSITHYFCYYCKGREFIEDHIIATEEGQAARAHMTCWRPLHPNEQTWIA